MFERKRKIPEVPSLSEGTEAPDFHAETIDGEIISLADFAGGGFSLVFVSMDCAACRAHFPNLSKIEALARRVGERLVVVGFTDTASRQELHDTLRVRHGFPGPIVVVARNHVLRRLYNPKGATPFFYYVDGGIVRNKGGLDTEHWAETVKRWQAAARQEAGPRPGR